MGTRWKRDWDAFRTDVYKANRDFRHFAKTTVHDVANTVGQGDTELDEFVDQQFNKNTGLIYKRTPGNKRQKLMKYSRGRTRGRSRTRTRSRRPLRRLRRSGRKPSFRRARSKSRMGGLRSMIKRVAMEAVEPKRAVVSIFNEAYLVNTVRWVNCTLVPTNNTGSTFSAQNGTAQGFKVFAKGIRIRGWVSNVSNLPCIGKMMVIRQSKNNATNLATPVAAASSVMWHDPKDGRPSTYATLSALNKLTPKLSSEAGYTVLKQSTFKLNSTRRVNAAAGTDAGTNEQLFAEDDTSDTMHFDWWIPLNKVMQFINIVEAGESRLRGDIFFGYFMNPHTTELVWDPIKRPKWTFDYTLFYKDA